MKERSLRDLFFRIKQILPEDQEVLSVRPQTKVCEALSLMRKSSFSQIPVTVGREVLGVFTYRSFAEGVCKLPAKERDVLNLPVEEFLEDLRFARITDELVGLLDELDLKDAVLVGSEQRLQGIVTTVDALRYFYKVASPYVILREIELAIRELIRSSVSDDELSRIAEKSLGGHYISLGYDVPQTLSAMSLHDYVMLLRYQGTWESFREAFGGTSNTVHARLEPLPELRNDVFHFRRELTLEEYDLLRDRRDWLLKRIRLVEETSRQQSND